MVAVRSSFGEGLELIRVSSCVPVGERESSVWPH